MIAGGVLQSASSMAVNASTNGKEAMTGAKSASVAAPSPLSVYLSSAAEQTGGKCAITTSFAALLSHLDGLSRRPCPNVLIHLTPVSSPSHPASPRTPSPPADTTASSSASTSSLWRYRSEFVGVYVKSAGVWPCPEAYLPDPAMQTLPPREPHPTFHFSHKTKPLPTVLLDSANTTTPTTASSFASPSIPVSSAPPALPPLESSIPVDTYNIDPSASICNLLFADEYNTCRYLTAHPAPSTPPFGLLYANKYMKKAYLVLLPYDFPTFFSYLSRIDTHLRSLPLTSSSSAALTSNPALYTSFAGFLSTLPFYYWPAVQAALGRMHRLPRLDVRMDVSVAGGVSAEVSERMRRWKEEAGRAMKEEKEAREQKDSRGKKEQPYGEQVEGRKKKRRRENMNGEAAAAGSQATAESQDESKVWRRPLSAQEAEVEWLLATNTTEDRPLLPPPLPLHTTPKTKEEQRNAWRQRGRVSVMDLFGLEDDDVEGVMEEWKDRVVQLMQPFPLLASVLPARSSLPPSSSSALTLRPRLPPSASEPSHPIAVMGDFHAYLKSRPAPLREAVDASDDDSSVTGLPAFGSPYRRHGRRGLTASAGMDDDGEVEVNERDVAVIGGEMQQTRGKSKWRPKVSFRDFVWDKAQRMDASAANKVAWTVLQEDGSITQHTARV